MNRTTFFVWLAVGLLLGLTTAYFLRGQFLHAFVSVLCVAFTIGTVLCSLVLLWLTRDNESRKLLRWLNRLTTGLSIVFLALSLSYGVGYAINRRDVSQARTFCEAVVEQVEAWRQSQGKYPESLESLETAEDPPVLLTQSGNFYVSDGDGYVISFSEQNSLHPRINLYASQRGNWVRY